MHVKYRFAAVVVPEGTFQVAHSPELNATSQGSSSRKLWGTCEKRCTVTSRTTRWSIRPRKVASHFGLPLRWQCNTHACKAGKGTLASFNGRQT